MKYSEYFLKTSKTTSEKDNIRSSKLLKQAGFIQESTAGRYYFLPIGFRVRQKIMDIIRHEMNEEGCQEMVCPVLHPLELWEETNRTNETGFELMKIKDRRGAEFALGGTAEEMFVDLVRQYTLSYRDLPFQLYQFSPKFRDELRARGGLLRVREFMMKDGYSFHADEEDFKREYKKMQDMYTRIFSKLGLETQMIEADNGYIGGEYCHEFVVDSDIGESRYFVSEDGNYAAHEDVAVFVKEDKNSSEKQKDLEEVEAKRGPTMQDGVELHKLPNWQQIKDVLYVNENDEYILAIIRGDLDVNEIKLGYLAKSNTLRHATDEEIRKDVGSEPGFISPVGIKDRCKKDIKIIADESLRTISNAYGGSNKKHIDLLNINIDRDYQPDIEGDIAMAQEGFKAENEGGKLREKRGIEVGNIFQLGYHYSEKMKGANFIDENGNEQPYYMGCYGIGIGRTMAAIVENGNDEQGIIWPNSVTPFQIHLIALNEAMDEAEELYNSLLEQNIEVLFDDRDKAPGEKFTDADLIGIPIRVVVSKKTIEESSCEVKKRTEKKPYFISLEEATNKLKEMIENESKQ